MHSTDVEEKVIFCRSVAFEWSGAFLSNMLHHAAHQTMEEFTYRGVSVKQIRAGYRFGVFNSIRY